MSKLKERVPALVDREAKLEVVNNVLSDVVAEDGRVDIKELTDAVEGAVSSLDVVEERLIEEGRRAAAQQIVSAFTNMRTIKLDRNQRVPVYQMELGFAQSYFKVGGTLVPPATMSVDDFETLLDRQERRIINAQMDNSIWREFYERAKPGLEAGQNLVQQFETGALSLSAANGSREIEAGEEEEDL